MAAKFEEPMHKVFVATPCDLALPLYVHPWTTTQLHHVADSLPLWHLPPVYSNDEPEQLRLLSACLWLALHSSQFKVTKTSTQV